MDALTDSHAYQNIATPIARDRRSKAHIGSDVDYKRVIRGGRNLLIGVVALVGLVVLLSLFVKVGEVARARGEFIPIQRLQVIQTAEGGLLEEIAVRNDERVTKGQVIAKFRATDLLRDIQLTEVRIARLEIETERLEALASGSELNLEKHKALYGTMVDEALALHKQQTQRMQRDLEQKEHEINASVTCGCRTADPVCTRQHESDAGIA